MAQAQSSPPIVIGVPNVTVVVNDEKVTLVADKPLTDGLFEVTPRKILIAAEFEPADDWTLTRDSDGEVFDAIDKEFEVKEGESFTATFKGITPVS